MSRRFPFRKTQLNTNDSTEDHAAPHDKAFLKRLQDGDQEAWSLLVDEWSPRLYNYLVYNTRTAEDAQDVLSETMMGLIQSIRTFDGNVALKTSEGLASMIGSFMKAEFSRNIFTKIAAIVAYPVLTAFKKRMDHRRYNGAALLGLQGLVFKSHGSADSFAFERALNRAYDAARNGLLEKVRERIKRAAPLLVVAQVMSLSDPVPAVSSMPDAPVSFPA